MFGVLQSALTGFGVFFDLLTGIGMFFIYAMAYFNALVVVLPILLIRRFGVGTAVYLPWAVSGLFVEYYLEYVLNPVLRSPWAVVGWGVFGLLVGFSADLVFKFLPESLLLRRRAILTAIGMGLANFLLVLIAVTYFYKPVPVSDPSALTYLSVAPWSLPWLVVNSAFGGYSAYALFREMT